MKITTTYEENRFIAQAAKEYYHVSIAVDAFQQSVLRSLREITDEFDSKLVRLGLPFENAREKKGLGPDPWILRKITRQHLEAGICVAWLDPNDPNTEGRPLCVYWWVWLKDRAKREALGMRMQASIGKPFEWESESGTSYICLLFSFCAIGADQRAGTEVHG